MLPFLAETLLMSRRQMPPKHTVVFAQSIKVSDVRRMATPTFAISKQKAFVKRETKEWTSFYLF